MKMPPLRRLVAAVLSSIVLLAGDPERSSAQVPEAAGAQEQLDAVFEQWNSRESPGCAVGVSRDGEPVIVRSYGMADLEHQVPSTPRTVYEAGSVSKQFTAAAVVLLSLDGELSLDDDVRVHLPELPDHGHTITIRHLLNHTSGLRDWGSVAALSGWGRSERTHSHDHVLEIVSRQSALNHAPGDAYSYTNSGYNLLAMIVERVSGISFAEFSRERIFEPLGLASTRWRDDYRTLVPGRATAYSRRNDGFVIDQPIEHVHGNGGLLTTVEDLLSWTESLEAGSLAGPGFVKLMHETGVLNNGRPITYAAGLQVDSYRGIPRVSHTGATSGYRAFLARYPESRLGVAMLCNASDVSTGGTGNAVADIFLGDALEAAEPGPVPSTAPMSPEALQAKVGLYREVRTGQPIRLILDDGDLRLEDGPALRPLPSGAFQMGSGSGRLEFETDPDADRPRVRRATGQWPEGTYEPVEDFDPTPEELVEYVGDYHSPDAETTLGVRLEEDALVIRRRPSATFSLEPVYADAFRGTLGLIRFHRDEQGGLVELGISQARVHDIRFTREVP